MFHAGIIRPFLLLCIVTFAIHPVSSSVDVTTFRYRSFNPKRTTGIVYSGDANASSSGGVIDLALGASYSVGRAVYAKPIRLHDRATRSVADFVTHFTVVINSFGDVNKADGLTFFLARPDYPALDAAKSSAGGYLGLMTDALNNLATNQIVAVEFDTFPNTWDPSVPNHMGINVNSYVSKVTVPWQWDANLGIFEGAAQVRYSSRAKTLFARLTRSNTNGTTESEWNASLPIDLRAVLPESVVVGFTGSTGSFYQLNQISSWNFTSTLCRSKSHQCA